MEWITINVLLPLSLILGTIASFFIIKYHIKKRQEDEENKRILELNQKYESTYADLFYKKTLAQRELQNPAQIDTHSHYENLLEIAKQFRNICDYRDASELAIECENIAEEFNEKRMISKGYVKKFNGKWTKPSALDKLIMQNREREKGR